MLLCGWWVGVREYPHLTEVSLNRLPEKGSAEAHTLASRLCTL